MQVRDLIDRYLNHAIAIGLFCEEALAQRQQTFALFGEQFGTWEIEQFRQFHLTDWIEGHKTWKSSSTRKARVNQINAMFNWAVRQGRIASNPFKGVTYAEAEPRPCLTDVDLQRMVDHANPRFAEAMRFLRLTGCRLSEMCRITWSDVDMGKGLVLLTKHKTRKKTGKGRSFVLVVEAVQLLLGIRRRQGPDYTGLVFTNTMGNSWYRQSLVWSFRRLADRLGLTTKATLHGVRHQFATIAVENGAPLKLVAEQLGHASSAITERYYCKITNIEAVRGAANLARPAE